MTNARRKLSLAEELRLCTQINGICPLSGKRLFDRKNGKDYKRYQIAHIYPLNPSAEEELLLQHEARLSKDPNDLDNLIPLRNDSHNAFDNPRTIEEYRELYQIKKSAIDDEEDRSSRSNYDLEKDIISVINSLHDEDFASDLELDYEPKKIDQKVDSTLTGVRKRRIKSDVAGYYGFVHKRFKELEYTKPNSSELIAMQVKMYYLKQKQKHSSQEKIYTNIVSWIESKTRPDSIASAEIIASYFVQNCEIFE